MPVSALKINGKRKDGATLQNLYHISTNDKKTVTVCGGLSVTLKIQVVLPTCVRDCRIFVCGQHLYFFGSAIETEG